ncbi:MAG: hypothetical protein AAF664_24165, partial [Planctomycetota bacterium]
MPPATAQSDKSTAKQPLASGGDGNRDDVRLAPRPVAVVDIGTTSIRMAIAEIGVDEGEPSVRTLETLVQSLELGREVFGSRRISRKSTEKVVQVLRRYQQVLAEYGVRVPEDVRVVATTAVREAQNQLQFADRLWIATGFQVRPVDESEVNRITYNGVLPYLQADPQLNDRKSIVVEVGGGNTEMLILRGGNVLHSQTVRLGALRLAQLVSAAGGSPQRKRMLMESHIRRMLEQLIHEIKFDSSVQMVALGGDMRFAARQIVEGWDGTSVAHVPTKRLDE